MKYRVERRLSPKHNPHIKTTTVGMNQSTKVYERAGSRVIGVPARFVWEPAKEMTVEQMKALARLEART